MKVEVKTNEASEMLFFPPIPFIVKSKRYEEYFMVVLDYKSDKYRFVVMKTDVDNSDEDDIGAIRGLEFDSLEEMFNEYNDDIIMNSTLTILDEWKGD